MLFVMDIALACTPAQQGAAGPTRRGAWAGPGLLVELPHALRVLRRLDELHLMGW